MKKNDVNPKYGHGTFVLIFLLLMYIFINLWFSENKINEGMVNLNKRLDELNSTIKFFEKNSSFKNNATSKSNNVSNEDVQDSGEKTIRLCW